MYRLNLFFFNRFVTGCVPLCNVCSWRIEDRVHVTHLHSSSLFTDNKFGTPQPVRPFLSFFPNFEEPRQFTAIEKNRRRRQGGCVWSLRRNISEGKGGIWEGAAVRRTPTVAYGVPAPTPSPSPSSMMLVKGGSRRFLPYRIAVKEKEDFTYEGQTMTKRA